MHSWSFTLAVGTSINRIPSLRLPCNLSSLWPDTRQETKPTKVAGFSSAGVGRIPGGLIRLPAQVQVRYLLLFFDRLFTRPTDQPRHAIYLSNCQSKPLHPHFGKELAELTFRREQRSAFSRIFNCPGMPGFRASLQDAVGLSRGVPGLKSGAVIVDAFSIQGSASSVPDSASLIQDGPKR